MFVTPVRVAVVVFVSLLLAAPASAQRPNVLEIMTDDQTVESLRVMPNVKRLLIDEGTIFDRSFVSFPVCCPSRATFLTGQFPHNHAVEGLDPPWGGYINLDTSSYLPTWLRRVGYNTIQLGKFLNGYGTQNLDQTEVPPGWTEWQGSVDPSTYRYYGYTLNENGALRTYGEDESAAFYQTDFYARRAAELIGQYAAKTRPFFMSLNFVAPHHGGGVAEEEEDSSLKLPVVAPRHQGRFAGEAPPVATYNELDVSDKPSHIQRRAPLTPTQDTDIRRAYQRRLASLLAVDEAVERLVNTLERSGELENTLIIFTSDNGFFHGEHRIPFGKLLPYEPSIRVPLILRGPGVPRAQRRPQLVENVDLAPTIVAAARAKGDPVLPFDGRSLFPILKDRALEWGRDLLVAARGGAVRYTGLRTYRYLYVEYPQTGERELYDLEVDPGQELSVHADPRYSRVMRMLAARLAALRSCEGTGCSTVPRVGLRIAPRRCAGPAVRARLRGHDVQFLEEARYSVGRRLAARALRRARAAYRRVPVRNLEPGTRFRLRVRVRLLDGRVVTLDRKLRTCLPGQEPQPGRRGKGPPASRRASP